MNKKLKPAEVPGLRYEINEIFTPSTPVKAADLFAGRRDQIHQLIDTIAEPGRHALIYGERGVGKTSLSQIVEFLIPAKNRNLIIHRKPCDPSDNFTSIWKKIFRDIRYNFNEGGETITKSVEDLYPTIIKPYDVVQEFKYFGANDIPVFIIDEFNEIKDSGTSVLMANTIKALSDEGINGTLIIVGVADSITELFKHHESIDRCCEEVPMPRMSPEELGEIVDTRIKQLGMEIVPDARWKIIILSRGLPMYVHSLGKLSALNAVTNFRRVILEEDVDKAIEDMLKGSLQSLKDKYNLAIHSNQPENRFKQVLLACALTRSDDGGYFTAGSIREPLSKIVGKPIEIAQYQNHLNNFCLEKRGEILQKSGTERAYRYRFREPAMQPYVIMKGISAGLVTDDVKSILSFPEQADLFKNGAINQ